MDGQPVIKVDYAIDSEWQNEELFDDIEKAWEFIEELKKKTKAIEVTLVLANVANLYHEDGALNYEDDSELYI